MGWDFMVTEYNQGALDRLVKTLEKEDAVSQIVAIVDQIGRERRNHFVVQTLNEEEDLRYWAEVAFAETAACRPGVFFGRTAWIDDYAEAVTRRYGDSDATRQLTLALQQLPQMHDLLSPYTEDVEGMVFLLSPAHVCEIADLTSQVDPDLRATRAEDVASAFASARELGSRPRFAEWALPHLLGFVLHVASTGRGLCFTADDLRYLSTDLPTEIDPSGSALKPLDTLSLVVRPLAPSLGPPQPATSVGFLSRAGWMLGIGALLFVVYDLVYRNATTGALWGFLVAWVGFVLALRSQSTVVRIGGALLLAVAGMLVAILALGMASYARGLFAD